MAEASNYQGSERAEEDTNYDARYRRATIKILRRLVRKFEGCNGGDKFAKTFSSSLVSENKRLKALITLRLQYLHLFTLCFSPHDLYSSAVNEIFNEFCMEICLLRSQIRNKMSTDFYIQTTRNLIILSEHMTIESMRLHFNWSNSFHECLRCGMMVHSFPEMHNPALICLAWCYKLTTHEIAAYVGYNISCGCQPHYYLH